MNKLSTIRKHVLRGELLRRGLTLSSFADKYGYPRIAVLMAFQRHCGNLDSRPIGQNTKEIVSALYQEIQSPIPPITTEDTTDAA